MYVIYKSSYDTTYDTINDTIGIRYYIRYYIRHYRDTILNTYIGQQRIVNTCIPARGEAPPGARSGGVGKGIVLPGPGQVCRCRLQHLRYRI